MIVNSDKIFYNIYIFIIFVITTNLKCTKKFLNIAKLNNSTLLTPFHRLNNEVKQNNK